MNPSQSFHEYAKRRLDEQCRILEAFPWESRNCYADWLAQTYHFVCHSTRLLALAASRFTVKEDALHLRFLAHIGEEKSHEKLSVTDMKALGERLEDYPEHPETSAFYQSQYYLIEHVDPKTFFGYILALEGMAALSGPRLAKRLNEAYGSKATGFMRVHGEEDQDHIEKLYQQLSQLSEADLVLIRQGFHQSCTLYAHMLDQIVNAQGTRERKAA